MEPTPFIRIRNLHQRFGTQNVLNGIDLDIFRGETLVLIGGSGGGKSVLLKHLPGLLKPVEGTIEVDGTEISQLGERKLAPFRSRIAMMFQNGALFDSLTVAGNLAFPLREAGERDESIIREKISEVLEIVRLPGQEAKMPSDLSGGMRKRVALARAIITSPTCVLYDEPHAGLDPVTADAIDHLMKDLQISRGITNVVITHEMRSVFHIADRVSYLKDGRVFWTGTPTELRQHPSTELQAFIHGNSGEPWKTNFLP